MKVSLYIAMMFWLLVGHMAQACDDSLGTIFSQVTVVKGQGDNSVPMDVHVSLRGTIVEIAQDIPKTDCHSIIDGSGKYLMPGMVEMHGHLPFTAWSMADTDETYFLYLAAGVTTVRGMLGDSAQFTHRDEINEGERIGPQLFLAAPSLNGRSVSSPEQARRLVRKHKRGGWDLLKIHPGLTAAEYDAMADEARKLAIPFGGHVPASVTVEHAMQQGQVSLDHMDGFIRWFGALERDITDDELARAVAAANKYKTWIVPTQVLFNLLYSGGDVDALMARPENAYIKASTLKNWARRLAGYNKSARPFVEKNRQKLLHAFATGGANIVMGSDAPQMFSVPGFSIWREIELMRDAGLSADQILTIGTTNAGRYFGKTDGDGCFGAVKVGCRADLILVDSDPRTDIMNVTKQAGVMAGGRWFNKAMIDARLKTIAERHAGD